MTKTPREIIRAIINIAQGLGPNIDYNSEEGRTERYIPIKLFLEKLKEYREGLEE